MPPPPCRPGTGTFQGCGAGPPPCCCRASSVLLRAWSLITVRGGLQMGKSRVQNLPPPPHSTVQDRVKLVTPPRPPLFLLRLKLHLPPSSLSVCRSLSLCLWEWSLITRRAGRGLKDVGMCVCVGYLYRHLWNLIGD